MKKLIAYGVVSIIFCASLMVFAIQVEAVTLPNGSVIKAEGAFDIFLVQNGQKHRFLNPTVLKSWFYKNDDASTKGVDWSAVNLKELSTNEFVALPTGEDVAVTPGSFLIQFGVGTAIYSVGINKELYKLDNPATAVKFFGKNWGKRVIIFPKHYTDRYGEVKGSLNENWSVNSKPADLSITYFYPSDWKIHKKGEVLMGSVSNIEGSAIFEVYEYKDVPRSIKEIALGNFIKVDSEIETRIDGYAAYRVQGLGTSGGRNIAIEETVIKVNSKIYIIMFIDYNESEDVKNSENYVTYLKMLSGVRFK